MGRDGGQVVSVLALYSDVPSCYPAEACKIFPVKFVFEKKKINKKRTGTRTRNLLIMRLLRKPVYLGSMS